MKKKNITINDLARMVQKGFDETAKQIDQTPKKKDVDKRFEKIETTLIAVVEDLNEARKERKELKKSIDETRNSVDRSIVVKRIETEFAMMKEDLKIVKEVIKKKLGVDLA